MFLYRRTLNQIPALPLLPLAACLALLSGVLFTGGCASAPQASVLPELEHRWVAALQSHDTIALDEILDESFIDSTFRGEQRSKHDVIYGPPAGGPYHSIRFEDLVVRAYGRSAVVTGVNVLQGSSADDIVRVRFTDVFVIQSGRWRAVSAQETLQTPH